MGEAIGQVLPMAVVVGLSPVPIIAVILMLVTPQARVNGPAFLVGWLAGLTLVGVVVFLAANRLGANENGEPATWVDVLELLLGLLLLLVGLRQWRGRPRYGEETPAPAWMDSVEHFTPPKSAGAAVVLSAANPKNLVLAVAAAAEIAQLGVSTGDEAIAYFALGDRATPLLDGLKTWMGRNNAVIMAVICLVIGAKVLGDAISGFSA